MLIRMLSTAPGSVDGIRVASYEADQEYDLTASAGARELAAAFVGAGLAEEAGGEPAAPAVAGDVDPAALAKPGRKPKAQ